MWPTIGGLRVYTLVYVLSMFAHLAVALYYCRKMEIPRKVGVALSGCYVFGMAVGARILCDLLNHRLDWRNYLDIGYYFTDGLWGGPLAYLAVAVTGVALLGRSVAVASHQHARVWTLPDPPSTVGSSDPRSARMTVPYAKLLDLVVLTLPIPMILAKVACLVNGCCYGAPCDWPWALSFPEGAKAPPGIARHPTQLYEIVVLILIAVFFHRLDRARRRGSLVLWFVMLYGLGRPFTEWFREAPERVPTMGPFTASQAVCLAAALTAALVLLIMRCRLISNEWASRSELAARADTHGAGS